jgi:hypothetical protein
MRMFETGIEVGRAEERQRHEHRDDLLMRLVDASEDGPEALDALAREVGVMPDDGPVDAAPTGESYQAGLDDGRRERGAMFEVVARAIEFGDDLTEIAELVGVFREGTPHAVDQVDGGHLVDEVEAFLREQTD